MPPRATERPLCHAALRSYPWPVRVTARRARTRSLAVAAILGITSFAFFLIGGIMDTGQESRRLHALVLGRLQLGG